MRRRAPRRLAAELLVSCLLSGVGLAACGSGTVVVQVPFEAGEQSAVVAVVTERGTELWAVDARLRTTQPILRQIRGWTPEQRVEVYVEYYERPLDGLRLAAGALSPPATGDALPSGSRILRAQLEGSDDVEWQPVDRRPRALEAVRVPADTPCRRYGSDHPRLFLDEDELPLAFAEDSGGQMWVVTTEGLGGPARWRWVDEGLSPPTPLRDDLRVAAAATLEDGRVALAGTLERRERAVLLGRPGVPTLELVAAEPAVGSLSWPSHMAVHPREAGAVRAYVMNRRGQIHRVDAEGWFELTDLAQTGRDGALTVVGDDDLYVVSPDARRLVHVVGTSSVAEETDLDAKLLTDDEDLETVANIPGYGAFAGAGSGLLLRREGARWVIAESNVLVNSSIKSISPFGAGMLVTSRYGIVDQHYAGIGYCEAERARLGNTTYVTLVAVQGDPEQGARLLLGGYEQIAENERRFFVQWLDPTP